MLQRKTRDGKTYSLPDLTEIREGVKQKKIFRDSSMDDELGGEDWEEDEDLEKLSANARARKGWTMP